MEATEIEERVKALEADFKATGEELKQVITDIRSFLMEANNPIKGELAVGRLLSKVFGRR